MNQKNQLNRLELLKECEHQAFMAGWMAHWEAKQEELAAPKDCQQAWERYWQQVSS